MTPARFTTAPAPPLSPDTVPIAPGTAFKYSPIMHQRPASTFETTQWSVLKGVHDNDPARRRETLDRLCRAYWPAVYAFFRRSHDADLAEELTQAFFTDVVLGRALFESADPARGRLRALFRRALANFQIDAHRRREVRRACSLDRSRLAREEASLLADRHATSPDLAFDRRWAALVLEEALRRCERHFLDSGRESAWRLFESRVILPAMRHTAPDDLPAQARQAGFDGSPAAAAAALQYVKRRFRLALREVVAETTDPAQAAAEENDILALLVPNA